MLELRGRGQHDVGKARGVGQEMIADHGEEVLAREPAAEPRPVDLGDRRIGGPDHEALDGRRRDARVESLRQLRHIQGARRSLEEVGTSGGRIVERREGQDREPAAGPAPVAAQDRYGRHPAHERLAIARLLRRDAGADQCRPRRRELLRKLGNLRDGQAGCRGRSLERPWRHHPAIRVEVCHPQIGQSEIGSTGLQQMPADGRGQDGVGAWHRRQVDIAHLGRAGLARIDGNDARAVRPCLLDEVPLVMTGRQHVLAPQQDEPRLRRFLGVDIHRMPVREQRGRRRAAHVPALQAGPQRMKDAEQGEALNDAHRPQILERQQGFRAVLRNDGLEPGGDGVERLVPRDRLERAGALGARAPQRPQQPLGRRHARLVVAHLGAQHAARDRMILRALDADNACCRRHERPTSNCPGSRAGSTL